MPKPKTTADMRAVFNKLMDNLDAEVDNTGVKEFSKDFNMFLDDLKADGFFGPKGKLDPRK